MEPAACKAKTDSEVVQLSWQYFWNKNDFSSSFHWGIYKLMNANIGHQGFTEENKTVDECIWSRYKIWLKFCQLDILIGHFIAIVSHPVTLWVINPNIYLVSSEYKTVPWHLYDQTWKWSNMKVSLHKTNGQRCCRYTLCKQ